MTTRLALLLVIPALLTLSACGDDEPAPPDFQPPATLRWDASQRGITVVNTSSFRAMLPKIEADQARAGQLVIVEQAYSEPEFVQGGRVARAVEPRFSRRMQALYGNADLQPVLERAQGITWVVDLQRLDREWLVDWDGLGRDKPDVRAEHFTFTKRRDDNGSDYQTAVIESVASVFETLSPRPGTVIIGTEMERHYLAAPEDWPAFAEFVREFRSALRDIDPNVRVGVGMNWANLVNTIAAPLGGGAANWLAVKEAWETVIDPIYTDRTETGSLQRVALDVYGFSLLPDTSVFATPAALPESFFTGVATYLARTQNVALPVAWFGVGWPSTSASSSFFGEFFERFASSAGAPNILLASWWGYGHLLESSDCNLMTNKLSLSRSACYRGLYTSSGSPIPGLRDAYFGN